MNLSKSGVGYSVGTRGFRVGKDSRGRKYRSASIPGTGIYSRDYLPSEGQRRNGNLWPAYVGGAVLVYGLLRFFF